jgi:uncharacterized membrane protein
MNYTCQAAIGAVSGLRSLAGTAIIAEAANRRLIKLKRTPFDWLGSEGVARTSQILAVGEIIADKLPFAPNRTITPSLILRFVTGAICGMAVAGRHKGKERLISGLVGGGAAIAASYAGYQYRKHVKLPGVAAALIEDAVAVGAGAAVVASLCA